LYGEIVTRARTAIDLKLAEQIKPAQVFIKKITKRIYLDAVGIMAGRKHGSKHTLSYNCITIIFIQGTKGLNYVSVLSATVIAQYHQHPDLLDQRERDFL